MTNWYPFVKIEINGKRFNAICDMTEFSIMPKTIYKSLGLWGLSKSASYLKLADNSSKIPLGKIEDVQTNFCGNLFPIDYYVVECIGEGQITLGRSFLKSAGAIINMHEGVVTFRSTGGHHIFPKGHGNNIKGRQLGIIKIDKT